MLSINLDHRLQKLKKLLTEMTPIRGMVQIAQSESDRQIDRADRQRYNDKNDADTMRDRNLQTTIATVGFGLGAAQIDASVAPYIISQQSVEPILPPFTTNKLHPSVLSVLFVKPRFRNFRSYNSLGDK